MKEGMSQLPKMMRAIVLDSYESDLEKALSHLQVKEVPVPEPSSGQVLVRIRAAPCNPSDLLFLQGNYGVKKTLPAVPGWEGAGEVVLSGGGVMGYWLSGKRVACAIQADRSGTWAEYAVVDATACIPLNDDVSYEQGACLIVNPLTAVGMIESVKSESHESLIQTAAAGQLGRMVLHLAKRDGLSVINIVRRPEQVDLLKSLGAEHVLDSSEADFFQQLKEMADRLDARIALDAVGGALSGTVLAAMPNKSQILVYGALAEKACSGISPLDLIFKEKQVRGFWLTQWIRSKGMLGMFKISSRVQDLIKSGDIHTEVVEEVSLEDVKDALLRYSREMTRGKILIQSSSAD